MRYAPAVGITVEELASENFVVIEKRRVILKAVLEARGLNATQYRLMLLLAFAPPQGLRMQEIAEAAHLKNNIVSTGVDRLETLGYAVRTTGSRDGRSRVVRLTSCGEAQLHAVQSSLINEMNAAFNPDANPQLAELLGRGIVDGASIQGLWNPEILKEFATSANLLTVDLVARKIESEVKESLGISYNELRVIQRLSEVGRPTRVSDLAEQLELPITTITRAAQRLEKKGWLVRLASAINRVAVFLDLTPAGREGAVALREVLREVGGRVYWSNLQPSRVATIRSVAAVYADRMAAMDRAARERDAGALSSLEPLPTLSSGAGKI